jgi:hypothetical protein
MRGMLEWPEMLAVRIVEVENDITEAPPPGLGVQVVSNCARRAKAERELFGLPLVCFCFN